MANVNTDEIYQWQLTKTSISERIKHLYKNELMADVHFVMADKSNIDEPILSIPCHKIVLAVSSPVFFAMFYGPMPETGEAIELSDSDSEGFLELLRYIYCDEVKLTGSCVLQVLYLAKKYMIPSLTEKCRRFLETNINAENVLNVLPTLTKWEEAHLTNMCWKIVDSNTEEFLQVSPSSLLEDKDLLGTVLKRDSLNVSEIKIFQAINNWAEDACRKKGLESNGQEKRSVIGDKILDLIRFPLMSEMEFAQHVPDTGILTDSEIVKLFMYFNVGRDPEQFSFIPRGINKRNVQRCKRFACSDRFWYYNRDSEIILFTVNSPVLLSGVRLFGMYREKYYVNLKIGGQTVVEGEFETEDKEVDGYYGFDVLLDQFILLSPNKLCKLEAVIRGPKSFYGKSGKEEVVCGDVTFRFQATTELATSKEGQFAEIIFTCLSQ